MKLKAEGRRDFRIKEDRDNFAAHLGRLFNQPRPYTADDRCYVIDTCNNWWLSFNYDEEYTDENKNEFRLSFRHEHNMSDEFFATIQFLQLRRYCYGAHIHCIPHEAYQLDTAEIHDLRHEVSKLKMLKQQLWNDVSLMNRVCADEDLRRMITVILDNHKE